MHSPLDKTSPRRSRGRKIARWAGLALGGVLPMVGCQAEYAGMTLPSGKYMHDDVQYFPPGPDFPWANTQAATQRARMQAAGLDITTENTGPFVPPRAAGALQQGNVNQGGGVLFVPNAGAPNANPAPIVPVPEAVPVPPPPGAPPAEAPEGPGAPAGDMPAKP